MTTRIEIKNDGPGIVELWTGDSSKQDEYRFVEALAAGSTVIKYVWATSAILIKE